MGCPVPSAHGDRRPGGPLRRPRRGGAGSCRGGVRGKGPELRRARSAREPPGVRAPPPGRVPRRPGGPGAGAGPGPSRGRPGYPRGRRGLRAPRSDQPRRALPPGPRGRGRRGSGHRLCGPGPGPGRRPSDPGARRRRAGIRQSRGAGPPRRPRGGGVPDLHLGLHRPTQGGGGAPRRRRPPVRCNAAMVPVRPGRRLDALPLRRVRLLGVGALGGLAPRRAPGRGALRGEPGARGLPPSARPGAGDGGQPDAVGVPAAPARRTL